MIRTLLDDLNSKEGNITIFRSIKRDTLSSEMLACDENYLTKGNCVLTGHMHFLI